jgi:hypothetical protein
MKYYCPLCKTELEKDHFHKVIKIQEEKEKVQKGELEKLKKQAVAAKQAIANAKSQVKEAKLKGKQEAEQARREAISLERRKSAIRDKRLIARIKKLEEEKKMLQKYTSPQEIGLADEKILVARLKKEFPEDRVEHAGKGGDVLHFINFDGEEAGCIVYECKHCDKIAADHISQTALAKKTRQANYAILVTTGSRKGFSGLHQEIGIFIVTQAGVLTLAYICRDSLIAMAKQRLDAAQKEAVAKRLMDYITSPICKIPLEEAISHSERAHKNLVKEIKQHIGDWKEREQIYQTIHHNVSHIQGNVSRVLSGKEPIKLEKPTFEPLALPMARV